MNEKKPSKYMIIYVTKIKNNCTQLLYLIQPVMVELSVYYGYMLCHIVTQII